LRVKVSLLREWEGVEETVSLPRIATEEFGVGRSLLFTETTDEPMKIEYRGILSTN
jgi:hypothetical protein